MEGLLYIHGAKYNTRLPFPATLKVEPALKNSHGVMISIFKEEWSLTAAMVYHKSFLYIYTSPSAYV
jgi:hypothetical protein